MKLRILAIALALGAGACSFAHAPASVAGEYWLTAVDGAALPASAPSASLGESVHIVRGTLTLGDAPPQPYVLAPSGTMMPRACVHEIPSGASVDTAGLVTRADGSSYRLPECGNGRYTMRLQQRVLSPGGTSRLDTVTISGRYAWGGLNLTLVRSSSASGRTGEIQIAAKRTLLTLRPAGVGPRIGPSTDPVYQFEGPGR